MGGGLDLRGARVPTVDDMSAAEGAKGGVVRGFTATEKTNLGANTWRFAGVWTSTDSQSLTPALVEALEASTLYVNFHASHP